MATPIKSQSKPTAAPSQVPPMQATGDGGAAVVEAEPMQISEAELAAALESIATTPSLEPPAEAKAAAAAVWVTNKKVNALWNINQNRNVWACFEDVGWRRLAANYDTTIMAFTMLTASAKQTQALTNRREEADNQVHELYVW